MPRQHYAIFHAARAAIFRFRYCRIAWLTLLPPLMPRGVRRCRFARFLSCRRRLLLIFAYYAADCH